MEPPESSRSQLGRGHLCSPPPTPPLVTLVTLNDVILPDRELLEDRVHAFLFHSAFTDHPLCASPGLTEAPVVVVGP